MFGRDVRLKKESLTEQGKLKSLEIDETEEVYFSKILKSYLELSKSYRDYNLSKSIHEDALKLKSNIALKVKSKVATVTDLNRGKLLVLLRKEEVQEKKNLYDTQKNKIEKTLKYTFNKLVENDSVKLIKVLQTIARNLKTSFWDKTRSYRIARYREGFTKKEMQLKERINAPDLNLLVGYNKDDSTRFSTITKRNETVVGLKLEIPFGDTKSTANYEVSKIDLVRSELQLRKDGNEYERQSVTMLNKLKQAEGQLSIDTQKVALINDIIKKDEKRFAIGRLDLETLIQLKSDLATYRSKQEQSKLTYGQVLIDWLELNDALDSIVIMKKI